MVPGAIVAAFGCAAKVSLKTAALGFFSSATASLLKPLEKIRRRRSRAFDMFPQTIISLSAGYNSAPSRVTRSLQGAATPALAASRMVINRIFPITLNPFTKAASL